MYYTLLFAVLRYLVVKMISFIKNLFVKSKKPESLEGLTGSSGIENLDLVQEQSKEDEKIIEFSRSAKRAGMQFLTVCSGLGCFIFLGTSFTLAVTVGGFLATSCLLPQKSEPNSVLANLCNGKFGQRLEKLGAVSSMSLAAGIDELFKDKEKKSMWFFTAFAMQYNGLPGAGYIILALSSFIGVKAVGMVCSQAINSFKRLGDGEQAIKLYQEAEYSLKKNTETLFGIKHVYSLMSVICLTIFAGLCMKSLGVVFPFIASAMSAAIAISLPIIAVVGLYLVYKEDISSFLLNNRFIGPVIKAIGKNMRFAANAIVPQHTVTKDNLELITHIPTELTPSDIQNVNSNLKTDKGIKTSYANEVNYGSNEKQKLLENYKRIASSKLTGDSTRKSLRNESFRQN